MDGSGQAAPVQAPPGEAPLPPAGFVHQFADMGRAFWASPHRDRLVVLWAILIAVVLATAWAQIRLNAWNQPFYDALTARDLDGFLRQLGVFAVIAGVLLVLNVGQMWLNLTLKLTLRRGLVHELHTAWLAPQRAFRLSVASPLGRNPDQRLQADAEHLTELTTNLAIGLLQATLLLAAFVGVLWGLSAGLALTVAGRQVEIPGFMVWCAIFYALTASLISWRVGRPLIGIDAERYAREADYRFELVRISEESQGIALQGGEAAERSRLEEVFAHVVGITRRHIAAMTRLTWVTAGYGWFTLVAPILVASPFYFNGDMTIGQLMMVVGAFNQVQQSLRWYVDNFPAIADWRATLMRVAAFRRAVLDMDRLAAGVPHLALAIAEDPAVRIEGVGVLTTRARLRLDHDPVELTPGERVLIAGPHGSGKTHLFHALAGLWPWGEGQIRRPDHGAMMFVPTRAYVAPGTLREAVCYPRPDCDFSDVQVMQALAAVGLTPLAQDLHRAARWDRLLNDREKQRLVIARAVLHRPQWLVIDDALDQIDAASRRQIEALFDGPLQGVGLIYIGEDGGSPGFFTRRLNLRAEPLAAAPAA